MKRVPRSSVTLRVSEGRCGPAEQLRIPAIHKPVTKLAIDLEYQSRHAVNDELKLNFSMREGIFGALSFDREFPNFARRFAGQFRSVPFNDESPFKCSVRDFGCSNRRSRLVELGHTIESLEHVNDAELFPRSSNCRAISS
jgi:hypothetical protein